MSSIGNSGARSSGPTGWSVPGCSGGGGGAGRSGITLYHWRGISDSSRVILVRSATRPSDLQGNDLSRTLQCWSRGTTPWNPRTGGISSPQTPDGGVPPPHTPWPPWRGGSPAWRGKPGLAGEARVGGGSRTWRGSAEPYPWPSIPPDPLAPYSPAGQATRVLTAEVSSVIAFLA